jgi:hypothetical protein
LRGWQLRQRVAPFAPGLYPAIGSSNTGMLGLGGKRAAGYGVLGEATAAASPAAPASPAATDRSAASRPARTPELGGGARDRKRLPAAPAVVRQTWRKATLKLQGGRLVAFHKGYRAEAAPAVASEVVLAKLRGKSGDVRADIKVVKLGGSDYRLESVEVPET